jgi:predicted O-methyltransferase YrrM
MNTDSLLRHWISCSSTMTSTPTCPTCSASSTGAWLHAGSIVVADNIRMPGAPKYREYMRQQQGHRWQTIEHKAHVEYQSMVSDLVLESEYLG